MNATCCPACGSELRDTFRFCPGCARPLRRKLVEFFAGHPERPGDAERMLRLSRYLPNGGESSHARFSIWNEHQVVEAALSIDDAELARLLRFCGSQRISAV